MRQRTGFLRGQEGVFLHGRKSRFAAAARGCQGSRSDAFTRVPLTGSCGCGTYGYARDLWRPQA